jgi:hypothetical protein
MSWTGNKSGAIGAWRSVGAWPNGCGFLSVSDFDEATLHYRRALLEVMRSVPPDQFQRIAIAHFAVMDARMVAYCRAYQDSAITEPYTPMVESLAGELRLCMTRSAALAIQVSDHFGMAADVFEEMLDRACWLAWRVLSLSDTLSNDLWAGRYALPSLFTLEAITPSSAREPLEKLAAGWQSVSKQVVFRDGLDMSDYIL